MRRQIEGIIQMERQRKVAQLRKMMENLPDERRLLLTREQYLLNFGAETGFRNAIEGGGLRPTILGIKRDYDCFDINFRRYAGERWTVKYDPDDLGEVLAVSEDGSLRFMLTEKYVQPMALADRKPGVTASTSCRKRGKGCKQPKRKRWKSPSFPKAHRQRTKTIIQFFNKR